jgi:iron complex outermembrane receptor protein
MRVQKNSWVGPRAALHRRVGIVQLLVGSFSIGFAGVALAQAPSSGSGSAAGAASDPFAGVEEMVVVGSGMVGALTETSTSVTAFDSMKLEALGVSNVADVAAYTPNLEIRTASSTTPTFFIRGVGLNNFTANAASAVAVYVDDAPRNLPAIQLGLLYDLDGLEVQKGPQGSGPGRNASAGAIRMYTKKPKGEYDAYLSIDYGNYNLIDVEGALEVPIVEDVLGIRTAFKMKTRDGIVTNRCGGKSLAEVSTGDPICGETPNQAGSGDLVIRPNLERDLNNADAWATRTSLRFLPPIDDMEWNLVGHVDRTDQLATVGQHLGTAGNLGGVDGDSYRAPEVQNEADRIVDRLPPVPTERQCRQSPDPVACRLEAERLRQLAVSTLALNLAGRPLDRKPFEGDYNTPGFERQTSAGFSLTGDWEIEGLTVKNITGFERYDRERLIDADYSPNVTFEFDIEDDAWQFTEDVRIGSELESLPITWGAGAFYLQEELDYAQLTLASGGAVEPIFQAYVQETKSFGIYADFSWDFLDDLTLDAGIRYNWESKYFNADIRRGGDPLTDQCQPDPTTGPKPCSRTSTVDHPTGTLGLTYRFDEDREFFFKYSHGWKGEQFNVRDATVVAEVTDVASPEVIDAFEVGFSGGWLEDMVKVNGALFWYAYQNYQVFTFTNTPRSAPVQIVINAEDALNFGAELETIIQPIEGFTADVKFGWLETKFLDFTSSGTRPVPNGNDQNRIVIDYNGNPLPNAPRFKISGGFEYVIDLDRLGRITPRYDVSWTDEVHFDPSEGRGAPDYTGSTFLPAHTISQKPFALHNIAVRYMAPSEQLEVAIWARNLTNVVYKNLAFDASAGPGFVGNLLGDPRTYGVTFKVTY